MKKLNLLSPDVRTGFLEGRGRELIRYLEIPEEMKKSRLTEDLKNGALFFETLKEQAEKKPSRVVVIRSDNEELGFMALTYLAGIYNDIETRDTSDQNGFFFGGGIMDENGEDVFENEYADEEEEEFALDDVTEWHEHCRRIPIITIAEVRNDTTGGNLYSVFDDAGLGMKGENNARRRDPWWYKATRESVCVIENPGDFTGFCGNPYANFSSEVGMHFRKNRHLFVLDIKPDMIDEFPFEDSDGSSNNFENPEFTRMVLEESAAVIDLRGKWDKEKVLDYRTTQFENWVEREQFTLAEDFPCRKITGRINSMRNPAKSILMGQILHYIRQQGSGSDVLEEKDFDVLKRFANLVDKKTAGETSAKKLEKGLCGMEEVKQRVREVVDVMKYYRRRENLGLDKGEFHNVHVLLGAPGTAKTTVAKYMGQMMMEENLLPGNRFTCINGADLKGMYVGHTAPKVKNLFENNDIIMIDEAYSLTISDGSSAGGDIFSQEAVSTLITEIENRGNEKLVLFAGYGGVDVEEKDNLMKRFIDSNPGLKSRINSTIYFKSYTPDEMVEIVHRLAANQQFILGRRADNEIKAYFMERSKSRDFGNGREARSLLENAAVFAAQRTRDMKVTANDRRKFQEITPSDIRKAIARQKRGTCMQNGRGAAGRGFGFGSI
ncbi:MAG: AAA family ATPase [Lachnospiraceae bacterium]|nr:AAA family ATPase [Lachnospiraceae bacterium]